MILKTHSLRQPSNLENLSTLFFFNLIFYQYKFETKLNTSFYS